MRNETEWAIRNLELAGFLSKKSDYNGGIGNAVKELLETMQKQGHSGASHAQTLRVFFHVASGKSLTMKHWRERFKEYNKLAKKMGGKPWKQKDFERMVSPKPKVKK